MSESTLQRLPIQGDMPLTAQQVIRRRILNRGPAASVLFGAQRESPGSLKVGAMPLRSIPWYGAGRLSSTTIWGKAYNGEFPNTTDCQPYHGSLVRARRRRNRPHALIRMDGTLSEWLGR